MKIFWLLLTFFSLPPLYSEAYVIQNLWNIPWGTQKGEIGLQDPGAPDTSSRFFSITPENKVYLADFINMKLIARDLKTNSIDEIPMEISLRLKYFQANSGFFLTMDDRTLKSFNAKGENIGSLELNALLLPFVFFQGSTFYFTDNFHPETPLFKSDVTLKQVQTLSTPLENRDLKAFPGSEGHFFTVNLEDMIQLGWTKTWKGKNYVFLACDSWGKSLWTGTLDEAVQVLKMDSDGRITSSAVLAGDGFKGLSQVCFSADKDLNLYFLKIQKEGISLEKILWK